MAAQDQVFRLSAPYFLPQLFHFFDRVGAQKNRKLHRKAYAVWLRPQKFQQVRFQVPVMRSYFADTSHFRFSKVRTVLSETTNFVVPRFPILPTLSPLFYTWPITYPSPPPSGKKIHSTMSLTFGFQSVTYAM